MTQIRSVGGEIRQIDGESGVHAARNLGMCNPTGTFQAQVSFTSGCYA